PPPARGANNTRRGVAPAPRGGDPTGTALLAPSEPGASPATGTAIVGQYLNTGTAAGTAIDPATVTASDTDRYFGIRQDIPVVPPTVIGKLDLLGSHMTAGPQGALMGQAAYVSGLYQDVLGRAVDAAGVNYWGGLLLAGWSRARVAQGVWESPEHRGLQVDGMYRSLLHRPADALGLSYWGGRFLAGQTEEQ